MVIADDEVLLEPVEFHKAHSARLLAHAPAMLEAGDRLQASEKIWGAVSHAVTAFAMRKKWAQSTYSDKQDIIRYISEQTDSPRINLLYDSVCCYRVNLHGDAKDDADIAIGIQRAQELVELLDAADAELDNRCPAPHGRAFREYERRHMMEPDPPYSPEEWRRHIQRLESQLAWARSQAAEATNGEEPA